MIHLRSSVRWLARAAALSVFAPAIVWGAEPEQPGAAGSPGTTGGERNLIMGTGEPRDPQPFTREQRMLDAVRHGDRATVERALELGVAVETADDLKRSALLLAARDAGDLDLVRFLHERGAQIDRADASGRTPLSYAASAGRTEIARYLLANGAALDSSDRRGRTPLFHAVLGNQLEMVRDLLERGAEVESADRFADTPFIMACAKGFAEIAQLLLDQGADRAARNQEGRSAADRAAPGLDVCHPGSAS